MPIEKAETIWMNGEFVPWEEAKVHVLSASGRFVHPPEAILKVGPGHPFFYCDGEFEVSVPVGGVRASVDVRSDRWPDEVDSRA